MTTLTRAPKVGALLTAMLTPFDTSGDVDHKVAARLARFLVDEGNDGLVVCGTTGEAPALSDEEMVALFATVKDAVGDRASIVAGTGGNNTRHSVELTQRAEALGVDGILAVVPYYNKPTQDGMLLHFGAIAEATKLPVIVYNIPARTGANMLPATLLELAGRYENIAGVKESSGDCSQFSEILRSRPPGFGFWVGDDHMFLPSLALGADGLISVAAHLCAREYRALLQAFRSGDTAAAADTHLALAPLVAAQSGSIASMPATRSRTFAPCRRAAKSTPIVSQSESALWLMT
jgi:4-hydroxy-tetrahydrodipicolinate synthase